MKSLAEGPSAPNPTFDWISLVSNYGPLAAIVAWFLYRDKDRDKQNLERERRMADRLDAVEDDNRKLVASALKELTETFKTLYNELLKRPCFYEDKHNG